MTSAVLSAPAMHAQPPSAPAKGAKVAYIMSRFPKLTETFILYEMLAVAEHGVEVEIYPLWRERGPVVHPEAQPLVSRAHFEPSVAWRFMSSHLYFLRRSPATYLGALWGLLRRTLPSLRYFAGALALFPKSVHFARQMQCQGVSHIHAHFASHPAAAAWVIGRLTGIPFSFTAHGSDLHRDRRMLPEKVAEAEFVVTISEYNRDLILAECGTAARHKTHVIHCGVDTSRFRSVRPLPSPQRRSEFRILCVGTLHEVKGQTYLIEACRRLHQRGVPVSCHFIGDGPDAPQLRRGAEHAGIAGSVVFHGCRSQTDVAQLLATADVLAAPSVPTRDGRREGIPVVLMEAMCHGVPVVASRLSGIPELVEHECTGLLVPPRDSLALADALERLWSDGALRQKLADAGQQRVEQDFNLQHSAAQLAARFQMAGHA